MVDEADPLGRPDNVIPFPGQPETLTPEQMQELAAQLIDEAGGPQAALAAIAQWTHQYGGFSSAWTRRQPVLLPRHEEPVYFVVKVELNNTHPPIWRRLRLASDLTLPQVHEIIQIAMGWTDSHLHHFEMGPGARDLHLQPFLNQFDLDEGEDGILDDHVRLDEVMAGEGDRLHYIYDFGDHWQHTIRLEKILPFKQGDPVAKCLAGRRACPPEDIGGIGGHQELLDALAGQLPSGADEEWIEGLLAWLPDDYDPAAFSVDEVNQQLLAAPLPDLAGWHPLIADLLDRYHGGPLSPLGRLIKDATTGPTDLNDAQVQAAVRRYQHLLRTIGDGVKLTAAGYLPPRIVHALYLELGLHQRWIGAGNREDQTLPVLDLRETATALGLLRKHNGRLSLTRFATQHLDDPRALLAHIGSRLPLGRPYERDAGLVALLQAAVGQPLVDLDQYAGGILLDVGWRVDGATIEQAARQWTWPTMSVFEILTADTTDPGLRATIARSLLHRGGPAPKHG